MNIKEQYNNLQKNRKKLQFKTVSYENFKSNYTINSKSKSKIAIIIPFREHVDSNVRFKQINF